RNGAIHERDYPARNVTPGRRAASLVARCRDGYAQLAEHPAITPSLIEAKNGGLPEDSAPHSPALPRARPPYAQRNPGYPRTRPPTRNVTAARVNAYAPLCAKSATSRLATAYME